MSSEAGIKSLIARFMEIRNKARTLSENAAPITRALYTQLDFQTKALIESYETARNMFATVSNYEIVLNFLQYDQSVAEVAQLDKLSIECAAAIGFLETLRSPIPTADKDRLKSLRDQIASLEAFNENLFRHVSYAISEYEKAHYLASALLAGKCVIFAWEQFPGKDREEKVSNLVQSKLLEEKLREQYLKAEKSARNYFTHDISAIPQPQDALALVAQACNLSMTLMTLQNSSRSD